MLEQVAQMLENASRVLVVSHYDPDGDALGSSLGMMHLLTGRGAEVWVHSAGPVPEEYLFLPGMDKVSSDMPDASWPDCALLLDCHQAQRTGARAEAFLRELTPLAVMDHHQGEAEVGQAVWIDTERAATSEMAAELAFERGWDMTPDAAACLFTGLQTDTGSFRYSNTSPRALALAGRLVQAGADPWAISQEVYANTARRLKMLGRVGDHLEILAQGRLAVSWVSQADFADTGCGPEDLEQVVEELRSIRGVRASLLLRELPDGRAKISMRSRGQIDVSAVALDLGGGGHHNAAGATVDGPLDQARHDLGGRLAALLERAS